MTRTLMVSALLCLAGCASVPDALEGQYAPLAPGDAVRSGTTGDAVRWGGRLVRVENRAEQSCFEVVAVGLSAEGRPLARDQSAGRFIACRAGFYEPEIFQAGREVTITGRISGYQTRKVDDYDYRYPLMDADVVFLWPERQDVDVIVERYPFY
jgi:outer membrane lipoprotein